MFDGNDRAEFDPWWQTVLEYLRYYKTSYRKDADKITYTGSVMKSKAKEWYLARGKKLRKQKLVDNWTEFSEAIQLRYEDKMEEERDARKLRALKYEENIQNFLTSIDSLNTSVGLSGAMFRELVLSKIPEAITDLVYSRMGGIPKEDDTFRREVEAAGLVYEEKKLGREFRKQTQSSHTPQTKSDNSKDKLQRE